MGQRTRILGYQEPGQLKKENAFTAYHAEKRFLFEVVRFRDHTGKKVDSTGVKYQISVYAIPVVMKLRGIDKRDVDVEIVTVTAKRCSDLERSGRSVERNRQRIISTREIGCSYGIRDLLARDT